MRGGRRVVMASENPDHEAIERLAERQHRRRKATFQEEIGRSRRRASRRVSEREPTNEDRLEWARSHFARGDYAAVIGPASRVSRSPAASLQQIAEAMRLRAAALAEQGSLADAIDYGESALAVDPDGAGLVPAARLRVLIDGWKLRRPLLGG